VKRVIGVSILVVALLVLGLSGCSGTTVPAATGATGPQGIQGTPGVKGDVGAIGPKGADGVGVTTSTVNASGHLILTLSNGTTVDAGIVTGATGPAGTAGAVGPQGATGVAGESASVVHVVSFNTTTGSFKVDTAGTYGTVLTFYGTLTGTALPTAVGTGCTVSSTFTQSGLPQTVTYTGLAQLTNGQTLVTAVGTPNPAWSSAMVGYTFVTGYTISGVYPPSALVLNTAYTGTTGVVLYNLTVTVPSSQVTFSVVIPPTSVWTTGQSFSVVVSGLTIQAVVAQSMN
jgi:hypothetical protein